MANSTEFTMGQFAPDQEVWKNLKDAIATSSGFKRWQAERLVSDEPLEQMALEDEVYLYLRETLKTLAY